MSADVHRIRTGAMLVIGDEVLNGKIKDTNSKYFAEFCFKSGIDLRRITVVPDERQDIIQVLNDLCSRYDFIVTSGGIGPTHDDITYESIAEAFSLPLKYHQPTIDRMNELAQHPPKARQEGSPELVAQLRMALFPEGGNVDTHYVDSNLWVPVVAVDSKVYVFPGVPTLFTRMLDSLLPFIASRIDSPKLARRYISTSTLESVLASTLTQFQQKYGAQGIKIGSYPHLEDHINTVSLIGPADNDELLQEIVSELAPLINGKEVSIEEEDKLQ